MPTKELRGICGLFVCERCGDYAAGLCAACEPGNERHRADSGSVCAVYACAVEQGLDSCRKCTRAECPPLSNLGEICPLQAQSVIGNERALSEMPDVEVSLSLAKHLSSLLTRRLQGQPPPPKVPERAVVRMRWYMKCLEDLVESGVEWVSSATIGEHTGVESWLVRKDLSYFGEFGKPRRGYRVTALLAKLDSIFRPTAHKRVAWLGPSDEHMRGCLLPVLAKFGCNIVAAYDTDPSHDSAPVPGMAVHPLDQLVGDIADKQIDMCVLCRSSDEMWDACKSAVDAGVKVVLNLSAHHPPLTLDAYVWDHNIENDLFVVSYYCSENTRMKDEG